MTIHHSPRRVVITAGPTHEPIDAVRYLANRSSGRLGRALAEEAAHRGWDVTLLLGPVERSGHYTQVRTERFTTTADLQNLLRIHIPDCDVLIMAAAVADFRPKRATADGKLSRSNGPYALELEPTPDLLAEVAMSKRPDQLFVGFALEPRDSMRASALRKLERKHVDAIVANPLETMGSDTIEAEIHWRDGQCVQTPGVLSKSTFASWLLDQCAGAPAMRDESTQNE